MSSTLTRAIRYDLLDELDELYEALAGFVIATENNAATSGLLDTVEAEVRAEVALLEAFDRIEGRVAVLDSAGGHEHDRAGELDGKAGIR